MSGGQIDSVMQEDRVFPPAAEFAKRAQIGSQKAYEELYERAKRDPEKFWGELAKSDLMRRTQLGGNLDHGQVLSGRAC